MHTLQDAIDDAWAAVDAEGDIQAAEKAPDASETAASSVYQIGPCTRMYPVASVTQEGSGSAALNRILSQMRGLWRLWQRRRSELRWFWMFLDVPTGRFDVPTARLTT